ncbi:MAG: glycosyltransferase family 4 protein [Candidatus Competibacteraceae bacterium]|nr:glycosyltransferase family 4 protein [Candidatus Competibacteraceae bacterium]
MGISLILAVDIIHPPLTGIGHYALQLARGLRTSPDITSLRYFSTYRWLTDPEQALSANRSLNQARRWLPCKPQIALLYGAIQSRWFRQKIERFPNHLLHVPNFILPPCANPTVTTLHDLSHLHYPQFHPRERIVYLERYLPRTLQHATRLIAVSEFVRQEIISLLGVAAERIVAVHNGVDPVFHPYPIAEIQCVLNHYSLQAGGYLLAVATLEPRKNLGGLAHAYSRLPLALRQHYPLVLVGTRGWLTEELERQLEPLKNSGQLRQLGYVRQEDLPLLYAGARAFAYPSLYEGFGLPVLEAMASGIPTLTSNRSSLPEVAGNATLLIDPEDIEALTANLERLLSDGEWRALAVTRGLFQASRFSWRRCVDETVEVYRQALSA